MKKPKILKNSDFCDIKYVPDGYDMKSVVEATTDNFNILLEEYNNLVKIVNTIAEKNEIDLCE
jgi:hypothetical protein